MKTAAVTALCLSALPLSMLSALADDRIAGRLTLTSATGNCRALVLDETIVAVDVALPAAASSVVEVVPVNRFRYNYLSPATPQRPTITGEIRNFGQPGCTVSFAGNSLSLD